ncbi:Uncharacterised protein [Serratia quinivorans]|jgi:hypothetical protein|nr:Uncharacterised protein [Serratia quinivorans]CAI1042434.1 Uncharacterised protein [Serratia quinivorans]CAI1057220.1 Uncharacterised protein [Serratia quinivorans]CAI1128445.1 Uncharacterised protein [Serratia quinivorans]CAI1861208.1 Uncharacterised protein [Serratia quinivorans]
MGPGMIIPLDQIIKDIYYSKSFRVGEPLPSQAKCQQGWRFLTLGPGR